MQTIKASVRFGSFVRLSHEMRRIATGVKAYDLEVSNVEHMWVEMVREGEHTLSIWMYEMLR